MVTITRSATLALVRALVDDGLFLGRDGGGEPERHESALENPAPMRESRGQGVPPNASHWSALNSADGQRYSEAPREVSRFLHGNDSESSAAMMNRGIDLLMGASLEEPVGLGAGQTRVAREEAA